MKKTNAGYNKNLHPAFGVNSQARLLFEKIAESPTKDRRRILKNIELLRTTVGLGPALLALYRQQVNSGFVLGDPLQTENKKEKIFADADTGVTFRIQWNPHRELRKNHALLIKHRVIAEDINPAELVNKDAAGRPCYLCKPNIDRQNPGEILVETELAGEKFYAGANFAYITNNHFTIMNATHRPQQYRIEVLNALNDFVDVTGGCFRAIYNGLAGATILQHEHLQATTDRFPIEEIKICRKDVVYRDENVRVAKPYYYIPVWLVEAKNKNKAAFITDRIAAIWHILNEKDHTENIICAKSGETYRAFVILRDRNKLAAQKSGKKGALAAFEVGGTIVLSYELPPGESDVNEKHTFDIAGLETIKQLLREVAPDEGVCSVLFERIADIDLAVGT